MGNGELFDEYMRAKEPGRSERAYVWKTAIGLQKVDGLTPSEYLVQTARKNIEGKITLAESRNLVEGYYKSRPSKRESADPQSELVPFGREQVREQVKVSRISSPSKFVSRLIGKMSGEMTVLEMMSMLKLGGRRNFLERYLLPSIDAGLVEMTEPDSPRSPKQRYRLTSRGESTKASLRS